MRNLSLNETCQIAGAMVNVSVHNKILTVKMDSVKDFLLIEFGPSKCDTPSLGLFGDGRSTWGTEIGWFLTKYPKPAFYPTTVSSVDGITTFTVTMQ